MKPRQRVSRAGLKLIKNFEGLRTHAARLGRGYVVGYGHTRSARDGVEVTAGDAEALLLYDLMPVEAAINDWIFAPITQNQFDALVSFAFSVGLKSFRRSNVLRYANQGAMLQAAGAMEMWRQADIEGEAIVVDALVRRRAAEKALFLMPPEGWPHAPSPVLKPRFDASAFMSVPPRGVEEVSTPMDGPARAVRVSTAPEAEPADDLEDEEEESWSAARAAAASVTARLQELLNQSDDREASEAAADRHEPEPQPQPPADLPEVEPFPEEDDTVVNIADAAERRALDRSAGLATDYGLGALQDADPQAQLPAEGRRAGPYMLLGMLGLVFWIMALVVFFRTPAAAEAGDSTAHIGWILGLLGLGCICGALWFLLAPEEPLAEEPSTEDEPEQ